MFMKKGPLSRTIEEEPQPAGVSLNAQVTRYSFVISLDISDCSLIMEREEFVSRQKSVREETMA